MQNEINLKFPLQPGGEEEGFNDAGIETFEGDIGDYIARECGQNTADASENGKAELHFDLLDMPIEKLPCLIKLKEVFERCGDYWKDDKKAVQFFKNGLSTLSNTTLPVLKISDYGTTGLTGEDTGRTSKWFGLVRSKGACNKGEGSGGSFGIGKYAPFAASALRTVYYYTKTDSNEAFQGISRLVTHINTDGSETQATGYIGHYILDESRHKYMSVRDPLQIPPHFRRGENEIGTDIYIPAYREIENWKDRLIVSVLNNFWPAICLGNISFKVGEKLINKSNIDSCIEEYRNSNDYTAYRYFNAYRNGKPFREKLDHVGDSELRLTVDTQRESNPVAVSRKSGMIIDRWGHIRSRKPISGIFICHDLEGNEVLRKLEPPRHDKWDQKRAANGKEVLGTIKAWIRDCIDILLPAQDSESFDLDVFSKFIPDTPDEDNGEDSFDEEETPENRDGFDPTPAEPQKNITKTTLPTANPQKEDDADEQEIEGETEEGDGQTGGSGQGGGLGGGDNGGGEGTGAGSGGSGEKGNATSSVSVLNFRSIYNESDSTYKMIFRSKKAFEGDISFSAECDDGGVEHVEIHKVIKDGKEVALTNNGKSFKAAIPPEIAEVFQVSFAQKEKMAVRIG